MDLITRITVNFDGIPKGKRKLSRQVLDLDTIKGHRTLSSDELNLFERKAWQKIDDENFKLKKNVAQISVHYGQQNEELFFLQLAPKQTQLIMR